MSFYNSKLPRVTLAGKTLGAWPAGGAALAPSYVATVGAFE